MNKLLGELSVDINGKPHRLKMTFEAMSIAEDKSGKTLSKLVNMFMKADAGLKDTVAVIYAGLYGANLNREPNMSFEELGNDVLAAGFSKFFKPAVLLLGSAYTGKPVDDNIMKMEASKENKEDGEKKILNG